MNGRKSFLVKTAVFPIVPINQQYSHGPGDKSQDYFSWFSLINLLTEAVIHGLVWSPSDLERPDVR